MKKLILLITLVGVMSYGQTVSLTTNTVYGNNCGLNQQMEIITINGDLNLNGYDLTLKNVNLIITGNLNGPGNIKMCGNPNQNNSSLCINGTIQNNPDVDGLTCSSLSNEEFNFTKDYGYSYKIYDIQGRIISEGITSPNTYNELPKNQILFVKVNGFKALKIYRE